MKATLIKKVSVVAALASTLALGAIGTASAAHVRPANYWGGGYGWHRPYYRPYYYNYYPYYYGGYYPYYYYPYYRF